MEENKSSPKSDTILEPAGLVHDSASGLVRHDVNAHNDPFIGKSIGNCQILEKINEGGTSYIYRAHNIRFDLDRVVKILKPSLVAEEDFFIRFKQEAQLVARFDHPNIMRVFDTGEVGGHFYIEMEFIAGQTLREYLIKNPRISERELLSIAQQMTSALEYAHNVKTTGPNNEEIHGILHRDIKPENIMITHGKLVKLMDFGAARALNISSHTMQGMIVGTFHYMSPEQISGTSLDARSDFFSLGIVLYELATGLKPFSAENLTDLINAIKNCSYTRVRKVRASISSLTEELIDRLLSRDINHRPGNAKEIQESITHCMNSYTSFGTAKRVMVPFSLKRHYSLLALIFSAIAIVLSSYSFITSLSSHRAVPKFNDSASLPLLEQGRINERNEQWNDAIHSYKMVPSIERGGLANEYLEAQIRMAIILIKFQGQYIKARKILEALYSQYSDPAIDAYLGRAYFHLGLYAESHDRFKNAIKSSTGSVIPQTVEFRREILYYSAWTLDKRFESESHDQALLIDAVKAWNYYIDFSKCTQKSPNQECQFAYKRRAELAKLQKNFAETR